MDFRAKNADWGVTRASSPQLRARRPRYERTPRKSIGILTYTFPLLPSRLPSAPLVSVIEFASTEEFAKDVVALTQRERRIGEEFQIDAASASKGLRDRGGTVGVSHVDAAVAGFSEIHEPTASGVFVELERILFVSGDMQVSVFRCRTGGEE